jgi:hypothetical protein
VTEAVYVQRCAERLAILDKYDKEIDVYFRNTAAGPPDEADGIAYAKFQTITDIYRLIEHSCDEALLRPCLSDTREDQEERYSNAPTTNVWCTQTRRVG